MWLDTVCVGAEVLTVMLRGLLCAEGLGGLNPRPRVDGQQSLAHRR